MVSFPPGFPFIRKSAEPVEPVAAPEPKIAEPVPPLIDRGIEANDPPAERRKIHRDSMAAVALVRFDSVHGPPIKVALTDISVAGVRFQASRPIDPGEKGQIRLEVGPLRWTTRLRVVHCTPNNKGSSTIGCAFLRTELLRPWPVAAA